MNMYKILLIAVFGLLFIQCQKDEELSAVKYYNFEPILAIDYAVDTISMGDTLWINSEIGDFLIDSATQKKIYFNSARIIINMMIRSWNVENQTDQPSNYDFDFGTYASYFSYASKATLVGVYYHSSNDKVVMKCGIAFNTPGTFSIDSDYLNFHNYNNATEQYYGGGIMEFYNLQKEYKAAYLKAKIQAENHNIHLYNALSDTDKKSFQRVDEGNQSKYFFIKVNE